MTALGMLLLGLGVLFVWSAAKGVNPRTVIVDVLSGRRAAE